MVGLNMLLLVALVGAGISFIVLLVIGLLVAIFLKVKKMSDSDNEQEGYVMPLSALMGGGGGGGGAAGMGELMARYQAAQAQAGAGKPDVKKANGDTNGGGTYL